MIDSHETLVNDGLSRDTSALVGLSWHRESPFFLRCSMKVCSKCKIPKSTDAFTSDLRRPGGLYTSCNACKRVSDRISYAAHKEQRRLDKNLYYALNREHRKEYMRKRRLALKAQVSAYAKLQNAKIAGLMTLGPCEQCSSTENIDGHHEDYDKPLEVLWLCRRCHMLLHAELKRSET